MPFDSLKHSVFCITQVVFWDGQEAEYELKLTCDPWQHRFFDFSQVHPEILRQAAFLDKPRTRRELCRVVGLIEIGSRCARSATAQDWELIVKGKGGGTPRLLPAMSHAGQEARGRYKLNAGTVANRTM